MEAPARVGVRDHLAGPVEELLPSLRLGVGPDDAEQARLHVVPDGTSLEVAPEPGIERIRESLRVLLEVEEAARAGRIDEACTIASETTGPAAAILLAGLMRMRRDSVADGEIARAVSTTGAIELGFLERGLVILATVANVAPLMGFLGTVAGMILAFAAIEAAGDVDPTLVAGGIKVALLTTATGLAIAIPVNIGYNYFVTRIDSLILDMEQGTQQILNLAWDMEKEGTLNIVRKVIKRRTLSGVGSASAPVVKGASATPPSEG